MRIHNIIAFLLVMWASPIVVAEQQKGAAEFAKKLSNPLADLFVVPLQYDHDEDIGKDDQGSRSVLNLQPLLPFTLSEDWNLVSRTILPIIDQKDVVPGTKESGLGDTLQSFFFSPSEPTEGGLIWGAGPVFSLDTASDDQLGSGQWAGGLTALLVQQNDKVTYGGLANHLEGFSADSGREEISNTFIQPFIAVHGPSAWTLTATSETSYDWNEEEWTIPLDLTLTKVVFLGKLPVSVGGGARYWLETTDASPEGWGLRLQATIVLPRSAFQNK